MHFVGNHVIFAYMTAEIERIVLHPSKVKSVSLLLGCIAFVVVGLYLGSTGRWIGYLCSAFFALGIPVGIVQLLPSASYLEIGSDGFTVSSMFRKHFVPWLTVDKFRIVDVTPMSPSKTKRVGYDWLHPDGNASRGQEFAKALTEVEGMLPDNYGKKAEELLEIMNTSLAKAREQASGHSNEA